uniref:Uncharacterized protein TCIL3000_11_11830 n=1 Tax=Trypanosoma congolense (strain IL3000) TaxID=1068625 RepID=G0V219_TRYCI|nr:unnamed protein product [Trypanosoma congolense IL3000]
MSLELYATLADLARLPREEPHSIKTLMCRVEDLRPPRHRELNSGRVFDISGQLLHSEYVSTPGDPCVRVFFYDEWASAAAFVEKGDIIFLKGFTVHDTPSVAGCDTEFPFFVTPIPHLATLRALQGSGCADGDTMEITVMADSLETPIIRVLPPKLWASYIANDVCQRAE